ncbi:transporter [Sphingobium sp. PNB]|uniref:transporter n=1 Tax=Sphingobium sp. PNB TaxID=863934 RepID=UPI001CA3CCC1|nr:transporter [Sphingobium sp. PNB]MCB4858176.1 transporter [Sphingobium sp. PNB]
MRRNVAKLLMALALVLVLPATATPALAQQGGAPDLAALRDQLQAQRLELARQERLLNEQRARLERLEDQLLGRMRGAGLGPGAQDGAPQAADAGASVQSVEQVGAPPEDRTDPPEVAVLADQGSIMTKAGRITIEPSVEYARTDRNRFVFRGIEVPQSVLVGVFDINESRQDVLTAAMTARLGLSNRLEVGARLPFVYRDDTAVLVPLVQNPPQSGVGTVDSSTDGSGLGDIELFARYQLTDGSGGWPFLIAGVQGIIPTGRDPFEVSRNALGNATQSATGAGFWAVAPNLTLLLPSDPATLFASIGYTFNFGKNIGRRISDALIERVKPGGAPNATLGVGIALNPQLSLSFAYAHTWQFATKSRIRPISISNGVETIGEPIRSKTRDLQIGRFLFGVGYRVNARTTINWTVEMGATDDASDIRTTLRIPFSLN